MQQVEFSKCQARAYLRITFARFDALNIPCIIHGKRRIYFKSDLDRYKFTRYKHDVKNYV